MILKYSQWVPNSEHLYCNRCSEFGANAAWQQGFHIVGSKNKPSIVLTERYKIASEKHLDRTTAEFFQPLESFSQSVFLKKNGLEPMKEKPSPTCNSRKFLCDLEKARLSRKPSTKLTTKSSGCSDIDHECIKDCSNSGL